jgi:hypothetical protein
MLDLRCIAAECVGAVPVDAHHGWWYSCSPEGPCCGVLASGAAVARVATALSSSARCHSSSSRVATARLQAPWRVQRVASENGGGREGGRQAGK